jgi:hypothetical protein
MQPEVHRLTDQCPTRRKIRPLKTINEHKWSRTPWCPFGAHQG